MNDGNYLQNFIKESKTWTVVKLAEELSVVRDTVSKMFNKEVIPDKYKSRIEVLLDFKFPKPKENKKFEESNCKMKCEELESENIFLLDINKKLKDRIEFSEKEIKRLQKENERLRN